MFDRYRPSSDPETGSTREVIEGSSNKLSDLSWETRLYCFAGCIVLSIITSVLSSPFLFVGKLSEFTVMTSLGSIISIGGTFFLSGPLNQLKKMFEPSRLIATLVYLLMIALTLIAGLVLRNPVLALIFIFGQYVAMAWYSLSFIPYARETALRCFGNCC